MSQPVTIMLRETADANGAQPTTASIAAAMLGTGTVMMFPSSPATGIVNTTAHSQKMDGFDVGGVGAIDSPVSRSTAVDFNSGPGARRFYGVTLPSAVSLLSVGVEIKFDTAFTGANSFNSADLVHMSTSTGGGGNYFAFNFSDTSFKTVNAHTDNGKGTGVTLPMNQWLWLTGKWDKAGLLATLNIYTIATDGTLTYVGQSTLALVSADVQFIGFGRNDATAGAMAGNVYYRNAVIDTAGTFPLLPLPDPADLLTLDQAANSSPVTELVRRATVGSSTFTEAVIQHSGPYPVSRTLDYVYGKVRGNGDDILVVAGTQALATVQAYRDAIDPL